MGLSLQTLDDHVEETGLVEHRQCLVATLTGRTKDGRPQSDTHIRDETTCVHVSILPKIPQQVHSFVNYVLHCILLIIHLHCSTIKTSTALVREQQRFNDHMVTFRGQGVTCGHPVAIFQHTCCKYSYEQRSSARADPRGRLLLSAEVVLALLMRKRQSDGVSEKQWRLSPP